MLFKILAAAFLALSAFSCPLQAASPKTEQPKKADEKTLSIIKPDSVSGGHVGEILSRFEANGLHIDALKMTQLTKGQAEEFYAEHRGRPFFEDLTTFMSSGPIVALVLEGPDAIAKNRELMGATDPTQATKRTIRSDFGKSVGENAVHGSDSPKAARREIAFFFRKKEIYSNDKLPAQPVK